MTPKKATELKIGDHILVSWNAAGPVEVVEIERIEIIDHRWVKFKLTSGRIYMVESTAVLVDAGGTK